MTAAKRLQHLPFLINSSYYTCTFPYTSFSLLFSYFSHIPSLLLVIFQIHKLLHGWGATNVSAQCVFLVHYWCYTAIHYSCIVDLARHLFPSVELVVLTPEISMHDCTFTTPSKIGSVASLNQIVVSSWFKLPWVHSSQLASSLLLPVVYASYQSSRDYLRMYVCMRTGSGLYLRSRWWSIG